MDFLRRLSSASMGNYQSDSNSTSGGRLISTTILHRHGARGPGESELSPWDASAKARTVWKEDEIEVITPVGHHHIKQLGNWFADRIKLISTPPSFFWRCSKSGRARESGDDFVQSFNERSERAAFPHQSAPYEVDADHFFRPWKIYEAESKLAKQHCQMMQEPWYELLRKHKDFLAKTFTTVNATAKTLKPIANALWSTTYLMAVRESEEFWENTDECDEHTVLSTLISEESDWKRIEEIALNVWELRFFRNGFTRKIGGKITREMLQRTLYNDGSVNVFSGHDYTVLAVLANLDEEYTMTAPTSFGGYLLMELWEGTPPPHPGLAYNGGEPTFYAATDRTLRIIYNPCPFKDSAGNVVKQVQDSKEVVIAEMSVAEAEDLVKEITDYFVQLER